MKNAEMTVAEMVEILAGTGTKEWESAIASRLETVRLMLETEAWQKGINIYLRSLQGSTVLKMLAATTPAEGINYLRGYAAALRLVICLPQSVEYQIAQESKGDKRGVPEGNSGY